ncbi:MAG TPA: ATP-dependent zinc metalloprotease FtsH [Thermoanaerobaculia bacterium]|nr:ATP-dependent zinc metalloprotease FtsH [Thermoanaerobaculia bacterium]
MNATIKNLLVWMVILVLIILAWNVFKTGTTAIEEITFSQFMDQVVQGHVQKVTIRGDEIRGVYAASAGKRETTFKTYAPNYPKLVEDLREKGVGIEVTPAKDSSLVSALVMYGPLILLVAIWFVIMRQMQAGGNKALSFGKSRAKLLTPTQKKVTFKDVAGVEEAKVELQEIIEFLKDPQKFQKLGGKIPKGVLLIGPPGTGKTLLARAVAGEANVPFFTISGSDFVEMFVGVGASRVRDLFEQGKKNAPCIIFIDEIDAVGRHRGAGLGGGHDEREQTLNALLVEMDGFDTNEGVILVAATNRPDVLDPALLRPGRFDRRVVVDRPDLRGREQILKVHTRNTPLADSVDLTVIARGTPGFSGADLANLVNEAALNAARFNKKKVEMIDFEYAKDKVMMGPERKSMIMTEEEKRNTAYHEGGHAVVAALLPDADPLHKVTIIPRGRALGVTMQLPAEDKYSQTKEYLESAITVMMGGRIAEEKFLGHMTTGAGNDIEKATDLARKMVCEWGMSEMGPLTFGKVEGEIFLGRDFGRTQDYSEATANSIDAEVKRIVTAAYDRARQIISDNERAMHRLARTLLEKEVLDGDEVLQIIAEESGIDVAKLRKAGGPSKPPLVASPGAPETAEGGKVGPLVPEPA